MATTATSTAPTTVQLLNNAANRTKDTHNWRANLYELIEKCLAEERAFMKDRETARLQAWKAMLQADVDLADQKAKIVKGMSTGMYKGGDGLAILQKDIANYRDNSVKVALNYNKQGDALVQRITNDAADKTNDAASRRTYAWRMFLKTAPKNSVVLPYSIASMEATHGKAADAGLNDAELKEYETLNKQANSYRDNLLNAQAALEDPAKMGLMKGAAEGDKAQQKQMEDILGLAGGNNPGLPDEFDSGISQADKDDPVYKNLEEERLALYDELKLTDANDDGVVDAADAKPRDPNDSARPPNWLFGDTGLTNNQIADLISDPKMQRWASDHGFVVGSRDESGRYHKGKDDIRALRYWKDASEGKHIPHRRSFTRPETMTLQLADDARNAEALKHGDKGWAQTEVNGTKAYIAPDDHDHIVDEGEGAEADTDTDKPPADTDTDTDKATADTTKFVLAQNGKVIAKQSDGKVYEVDSANHTATELGALPDGITDADLDPWWSTDTGKPVDVDTVKAIDPKALDNESVITSADPSTWFEGENYTYAPTKDGDYLIIKGTLPKSGDPLIPKDSSAWKAVDAERAKNAKPSAEASAPASATPMHRGPTGDIMPLSHGKAPARGDELGAPSNAKVEAAPAGAKVTFTTETPTGPINVVGRRDTDWNPRDPDDHVRVIVAGKVRMFKHDPNDDTKYIEVGHKPDGRWDYPGSIVEGRMPWHVPAEALGAGGAKGALDAVDAATAATAPAKKMGELKPIANPVKVGAMPHTEAETAKPAAVSTREQSAPAITPKAEEADVRRTRVETEKAWGTEPTVKEKLEAKTATPAAPLGGAVGPGGKPVGIKKAEPERIEPKRHLTDRDRIEAASLKVPLAETKEPDRIEPKAEPKAEPAKEPKAPLPGNAGNRERIEAAAAKAIPKAALPPPPIETPPGMGTLKLEPQGTAAAAAKADNNAEPYTGRKVDVNALTPPGDHTAPRMDAPRTPSTLWPTSPDERSPEHHAAVDKRGLDDIAERRTNSKTLPTGTKEFLANVDAVNDTPSYKAPAHIDTQALAQLTQKRESERTARQMASAAVPTLPAKTMEIPEDKQETADLAQAQLRAMSAEAKAAAIRRIRERMQTQKAFATNIDTLSGASAAPPVTTRYDATK